MSHDPIFFTPYQSARFGQARTLYKGGGDPGDGGAAAREADRQARIQAGTDQVNAIFGIGGQKTQVPTGQRNLTGSPELRLRLIDGSRDWHDWRRKGTSRLLQNSTPRYKTNR